MMSDSQDTQPASSEVRADGGTVRETTHKEAGTREQSPATKATEAELRSVEAATVIMERSGAEQITAERVVMERSGARTLDTKSAQLDRSGVVALGTDNAVLTRSSAVQVVAEEARVSRSSVVLLSSDRASLEDSKVVLFVGSAEGDVRPTITMAGAAVLGAAAGLVLTFMLILLGGRSGKRD